ncbi:MAG: hypothetical protein HFJ40_05995 [Clostridia bacterium]|nr:hypothetical protein [Clostridia bacterium]
MEDKSWIKLYRKILESPIFENEKALKVWIWCLVKATHKEREQLVGKQIVHLEKGQFVTGRKKASEELKMKDRTVYDYFKLLKELHMISIKSNNKFSIVTVEKWEDYQVEELKIQQQDNNNATTTQHKQECKELYLTLFNKYKKQIEEQPNRVVQIISDLKKCSDYELLTLEEQDQIFLDLMNPQKRSEDK